MDTRVYVLMDKTGQVVKDGSDTFRVEVDCADKLRELCAMICRTESMDDNEKQYWFDIMPSMTAEQKDRLFTILETERVKLEDLEAKYQAEILALNANHARQWQEMQVRNALLRVNSNTANLA